MRSALIKDVTEFVLDGTHGSPMRTDVGIPVLSAQNVRGGRLDFETDRYTSSAEYDGFRRRLPLDVGDVLLTIVGTIGRAAVVNEIRPLVFQRSVAVLRPKQGILLPRFLYYVSQTQVFQAQLARSSNQSSQAGIYLGKLKELLIPLPPLPEQRRIAEILDKADALRAKRRAALAQLDALSESTFLDMFGDPATNPKRFPVRQLSEFYASPEEGTKCGPFGSALKQSELVPDGPQSVPVWNMDNMDSRGRMVRPFRMWISESKYEQLQPYAVMDGDVIISRAGTVGKMCVAKTDGARSIINTNLIRLRLGPRMHPLYFVSLMNYCKGRVGRLKTGAEGALTHMSTGVLDTLQLPCPPLELQKSFAAVAQHLDRARAKATNQLAELEKLFASLQHRAFGGEL